MELFAYAMSPSVGSRVRLNSTHHRSPLHHLNATRDHLLPVLYPAPQHGQVFNVNDDLLVYMAGGANADVNDAQFALSCLVSSDLARR